MTAIDHQSAIEKAQLSELQPMLVGGQLKAADGGETLPALDPATGIALTRFPVARKADVDEAVAAARKALDEGPWWKEWGPHKRAKCLRKLSELCKERSRELSRIESLDVGMPRGFATKFSVAALVRNLEYYASWADKLYGSTIPQTSPGTLDYTRLEPYGVVASIISWNTPLLFVGSKLGPALATGNAVILKPSELACLGPLRVAELVKEAGIPDGIVQVLTGDGETGRLLVEHKGVDKVSFTGGRETARKVQAAAAKSLKPVLFELGGKSPNIVFDDANLGRATMMSTLGIFGLTGQACAAGSRLLVHRSVHDQLLGGIAAFAQGLQVGDPMDPSTMLGPLISGQHKDRVQSFIDNGEPEGASLHLKAELREGLGNGTNFLGPHIFTGVAPGMTLWDDEVFGPVLSVTPFDSDEEALHLANETQYGLAAGVWTEKLSRAHKMANGLEAGVVWINNYGTLPNNVPFGGFKQSGWGKEGGRDALMEYTRVKNVLVDLS